MHQIIIGLGSNIDQQRHLTGALDALCAQFRELAVSSVYASAEAHPQVGKSSVYYNAVVGFRCDLNPLQCRQRLRVIEHQQQRQRGQLEVSCDLDLLLYDDLVSDDDSLRIPHPDIVNCDYVLQPLAELLPNDIHPRLQKSYAELWQCKSKQIMLTPVDFVWQGRLISTAARNLSL